jgi:hypothetical protein
VRRVRVLRQTSEKQAQRGDAEALRDTHLSIDRRPGQVDLWRAMEEIAPSARDDVHALTVRRDRAGDVVDRNACFDQVMEVDVEIEQAEPAEHLQRRQQRLVFVRGRRRQHRRHHTGSNASAFW